MAMLLHRNMIQNFALFRTSPEASRSVREAQVRRNVFCRPRALLCLLLFSAVLSSSSQIDDFGARLTWKTKRIFGYNGMSKHLQNSFSYLGLFGYQTPESRIKSHAWAWFSKLSMGWWSDQRPAVGDASPLVAPFSFGCRTIGASILVFGQMLIQWREKPKSC